MTLKELRSRHPAKYKALHDLFDGNEQLILQVLSLSEEETAVKSKTTYKTTGDFFTWLTNS